MNELIAKIEQWAEDRNIIKGSKPIDQADFTKPTFLFWNQSVRLADWFCKRVKQKTIGQ